MASTLRKQYRLGEYYLEPDTQLLRKDGQPVRLTNLPFQVLVYLIENRHRLVSRAELLERFWEGREVYDDALRKAVGEIRKALDDPPRQSRFIETRRAGGYRYIGPLIEEAVTPIASFAENGRPRHAELVEAEEARQPAVADVPRASQSHTLPAEQSPGSRRTVLMAFVLAGLVLTFAAFLLYRHKLRSSEQSSAPFRSLAVLPLKNLSADPENEYFSDGLTETFIRELSKLNGLKVISRQSVFSLKGKQLDPREVGRQLGVEALLEGSVRKTNETLRVETRLLSAADGRVLWVGDTYSRDLKDLFALQDEIACDVATNLRVVLCGEGEFDYARRSTQNVEAFQAYLKGRYFFYQKGPDWLKKATDYYQQAIALDPRYAQAYAGLTDCYISGIWHLSLPPQEALAKAREAAARAAALDDKLAEAHRALANVYGNSWALAEAAREQKRALELDPGNAQAHHDYAYTLILMGQADEAIVEIERARELEPLSVPFNIDVGQVLLHARRYDEAVKALRHALEMDANRWNAHLILAPVYEGQGREGEAFAEYLEALRLGWEKPEEAAPLKAAYAAGGLRGFWQKKLELEKRKAARSYVSPFFIACLYARLGEKEQAFAWLEKAYRERSNQLINLKVEPMLDSLRSDPRFAGLLRRVGLPQ
jgi:TolB-like protein/DNA-binding winged helix-turn-helix (wHTH) protein/Tfp pilus assembly protein PilF